MRRPERHTTFAYNHSSHLAVNAVFRQQGVNLIYVEPKGKSRGFVQSVLKGASKPLSRFSREGLLRYVVSLPLNMVPMVGTVLFLLYNGAYFSFLVG